MKVMTYLLFILVSIALFSSCKTKEIVTEYKYIETVDTLVIDKLIEVPIEPTINLSDSIKNKLISTNTYLDSVNNELNNENKSLSSRLNTAKTAINKLKKDNTELLLINDALKDSLNRLRSINYHDSISYIKQINQSNNTKVTKEKSFIQEVKDYIFTTLIIVILLSIIVLGIKYIKK